MGLSIRGGKYRSKLLYRQGGRSKANDLKKFSFPATKNSGFLIGSRIGDRDRSPDCDRYFSRIPFPKPPAGCGLQPRPHRRLGTAGLPADGKSPGAGDRGASQKMSKSICFRSENDIAGPEIVFFGLTKERLSSIIEVEIRPPDFLLS